MIQKAHEISPELSKYMLAMLYHKDFLPDYTMDKYLPDGTFNIIFEFTGTPKFIYHNDTKEKIQEYNDVWFSGVLKDYITISAECEEMMVLVFKPGAGFPLLNESVDKYTNKVLPAQDVFGQSILDLHSRLKKPTTPGEKFLEIEKWLLEQFREDDFYTSIIKYALESIENSPSNINISNLAKKSGYSQKQFIHLFKKYVGITPKQFHRITRFNEILSAVEKKEELSWTIIAQDCGYFDQAHFIKDFKSFSGLNPKEYLIGADIAIHPNFIPIK